MSGHSHWSNIKRKKGALDAKRAKIFAKLTRAVQVAAKSGGADPAGNLTLKMAIEKAKEFDVPKDNIERAIERGAGSEKDAQQLETASYEAFGPEKAALIIETITDNKNRTLGELRQIIEQHGGKLASPGSVQWLFELKGVIYAEPIAATSTKEAVELAVIDSGAENFSWQQQQVRIISAPEQLEQVKHSLTAQKLNIVSAAPEWVAKEELVLQQPQRLEKLLAALDENEAVQDIFTNCQPW